MSLNFLRRTDEFRGLVRLLASGSQAPVSVRGVIEPAKAYFITSLAGEIGRPVVLVRPLSAPLDAFEERCRFFAAELGLQVETVSFPALFDNPYFEVPPAMDAAARRMRAFRGLTRRPPDIMVTNLAGLLKPVPRPADLRSYFLSLEPAVEMERERLLQLLERFGYGRTDIVSMHGEYAWRGGIVDVFPPWEENPVRIELAGPEVASLRRFDAATQRSVKKLDAVVIPSLREFPATPEFVESWKRAARRRFRGCRELEARLAGLDRGDYWPNFPVAAHLAGEYFVSVAEYLKDAVFVIDRFEETDAEWAGTLKELDGQFGELAAEGAAALPPREVFLTGLMEKIYKGAVRLEELDAARPGKAFFSFGFQSVPRFENRIPFFVQYAARLQSERDLCYVYFSSPGTRGKLRLILEENGVACAEAASGRDVPRAAELMLLTGPLGQGFAYPQEKVSFFAERDIFTEEQAVVGRAPKRPAVSSFQDIRAGDFVVHTDYGVGVFLGLERVEVEGKPREFIEILYRDGDKLLVPVEDLNLVQRFSRVESEVPVLDKLGTGNWEKTKARARKAVELVAKELVELYAARKAQKGFAFSAGDWEEDFDRTFEYEETEDQLRSISEVRTDMESEAPMDRLLCGDVGYGKTEVAMRAAFKAVMDGRQVAVLCPTTILASQHLKTFRDRLVLFPVRVEGLTRLQPAAERKAVLEALAAGRVDIIIGTHRLLSKDVVFKDLGLLIIDEEQRFGVAQKERIKQLKTNVDVLTLTATPIPRTLNMSLLGLRDISIIETPPRDRLSIHTVVTPFNGRLIASAVRQELGRGGQVYYIHNRIEDIDAVADFVRRLVPQARVAVIHGRMTGAMLEKRMLDFIERKYDVLVSTTIVENGIDIPLVNTLIVDRADTYGLAQLYQLRGRVGRSSRQAFAYFLVPPYSELTPQARERLKALKEFSELGSGFRLAAKDLEIRGAGTLLGHRQHGAIEAVGFDYYMQLLEQAVRRFKGEPVEAVNPEIQLRVDIRIPEEYIPQTNVRLGLYKRAASVEGLDEIDRIREEMRDRFGPPPASVENLLGYGAVKFLAGRLGISKLERSGSRVYLTFLAGLPLDWSRIHPVLKRHGGSFTPQGVMTLPLTASEDGRLLFETIAALIELTRCTTMPSS